MISAITILAKVVGCVGGLGADKLIQLGIEKLTEGKTLTVAEKIATSVCAGVGGLAAGEAIENYVDAKATELQTAAHTISAAYKAKKQLEELKETGTIQPTVDPSTGCRKE